MSDPIASLAGGRARGGRRASCPRAEVEPTLERPPRPEFGDFSTNAAMLLAPLVGEPPREVAAKLADGARGRASATTLDRIEVAGPGFLNLHMRTPGCAQRRRTSLAAGERVRLGASPPAASAASSSSSSAPTRPARSPSPAARHAAYGDSLARLLEFAGHRVSREYYVNDAGGADRAASAHSIAARMNGAEVPEGGYQGDYVIAIAERLARRGARARTTPTRSPAAASS